MTRTERDHEAHCDDVLLGILHDPSWRRAVLALRVGDELEITATQVAGRPDSVSTLIRDRDLEYTLARIEPSDETEPGANLYMLSAVHHPSVIVYAEEYEEAIGSGD